MTESHGSWLPRFETVDCTTIGDEWPTYIVQRWEENEIGERRFVDARTYRAVAAERERIRADQTNWWDGYDLELVDLDAAWLCIAHHGDSDDVHIEGKGRGPEEAVADLRAALEAERLDR